MHLLLGRVVLPSVVVVFGRIGGGTIWKKVDENAIVSACRGFCSVPGPLQSVQRAEFWGVGLMMGCIFVLLVTLVAF